ncbi:hypothetical protein E4U43_006406 [Claviceps pusilla]|uniref:Nonsense-mediated mRNA decay factor n=1 Tax=Claviceps pusilla TaxID=123648 RepID=A0A9P7NFZ0_9HYPO|nr:hypothetical protein E4U43_006406 [Claviceps pusilla]
MATATPPPQASSFWHQALKIRKHLLKQLEKVHSESNCRVDLSQFVAIESLLEKFRLSFVHTIFLDFQWAVKENAEEALWSLHTSINTEYRRIQGRLKHTSHAVERRKVEKSYYNFLRVAQKFYKGYIQRLTARYDVPELRRIAQGIEAQQMEGTDQISPVLTELRLMVLHSCHSTLLRMGDLSRYRAQARHKNSGYVTALTYYSLAHQLNPKSGHACHQMGIVHQNQGNHLDIVYYFYRSWTVESSHPLAKANLEAEFKSLRLPRARHNASGTQDAFSLWFVKLHALFYKGENFSQQAELEGEIMHRLEMACHSEKSTETLLKMTLVNIAAHHVAAANYAESQTLAASQFYHFTLRFNVLFLSHFCAALETELKEAVSVEESSSASVQGGKITPVVESLLPILRVYSMWLAARRQEIRDAAIAFGGVVTSLVQNLAKVFTLLCVFSYSQVGLASCPYLLSEDIGIRGFVPLSENVIPDACRCFCSEEGSLKTDLEDPSARLEPAQESSARVLDILRCAYFLAEDGTLPVSYRIADSWLIFEYSPGVPSTTPAATPVHAVSSLDPSREIPEVNNDNDNNDNDNKEKKKRKKKKKKKNSSRSRSGSRSGSRSRSRSTTANTSENVLENPEQPNQTISHQNQISDRGDLWPHSSLDESWQEPEFLDDVENRVMDMLTPFLKPPTPQPHRQQGCSPTESSYGVHSGTANELLGSFQTNPSPTSSVPSGVPSGKFAPLPWAWFNTPKPDDAMGSLTPSGRDAFSAQPSPRCDSPRNSFATGTLLDDPFATPGREYYGTLTNGNTASQSRGNCSSPAFAGTEPNNHQNSLLQAFSATTVPRSSPFTQWAENQKSSSEEKDGFLPRQSRMLDHATVAAAPSQLASTPGFSHPSSLYQSTPANVVGLGLGTAPVQPVTAGLAMGEYAGRYYQIDQTTTCYNDTIMQAAYYGNK